MARYTADGYDDGAFEDDYRGFEIRDDETARGPLILALAISVLLVFGAVVWNTYRQGVRDRASGVPNVIADVEPYKRAPVERGGIAVPDTDKRFYDQMDASTRPAEPGGNGGNEMLVGGPPIELRPGVEPRDTSSDDPETGVPDEVMDQVDALAQLDGPDGSAPPVEEITTPAVNPVEPAPVAAQRFAFAPSGNFLVQIAAFRSKDAAEDAWRTQRDARPDIYKGAEKRIQRADLGAKGVFYRLRIGAFEERVSASSFCDAIKDTGSSCIVVTE